MTMRAGAAVLLGLLGTAKLAADVAAYPVDPPPLSIAHSAGPITVDGDLSDEGWRGAIKVDTWYETNPGDNVKPPVACVGYLAYDERFFYAAFEFDDPQPRSIRAPFSDRDNVGGDTDY